MACNDYKNPLQRGGTDQQQRALAALGGNYVLVDEHDFKEWIVFANQFAAYIRYYDETNQDVNTWQPFFNSDISAVLGTIAIQNINDYRLAVKAIFDAIRNPANQTNNSLLKEDLNTLFGALLTLTVALDGYYIKLPDNNALKSIIANLVKTKLQGPFKSLLRYYKAAVNRILVEEDDNSGWTILNTSVQNPRVIISGNILSPIWTGSPTSLQVYYQSLLADPTIYGNPTAPNATEKQIIHASNHNLFTGIFDTYLQSYTRIINEAESQLLATLNNDNTHTPHYALFLTFLKLFKHARQSLNTLTLRHLDFYYKRVLKLVLKKPVPSHADLVFELAKQVDEFMLPAGTAFKAGKDALGKDVTFTLDSDSVFNKATVGQLMSIYRGDKTDNIGAVKNEGRWFASPVANSDDGLGAKLTSANGEWHPFFHDEYQDNAVSKIDMPKAQIGFAIASHYLYLNEGARTVNLNLDFTGGSMTIPKSTVVDCYITTAKGWFKIPDAQVSIVQQNNSKSKPCSAIVLSLLGNDPPTADYSAAVHGGTFTSAVPTVKVYLRNDDAITYPYDSLSTYTLNSVEVSVAVGDSDPTVYSKNGLKQLLASGDSGAFDVSKPFQPFGATPKGDSAFVIGNKELMSKKGAVVSINIAWANLPVSSGNIPYPASSTPIVGIVEQLSNGIWTQPADDDVYLFGQTNPSFTPILTINHNSAIVLGDGVDVDYSDAYGPFTASSNRGFFKVIMHNDLGFDTYQNDQINYLIKLALGKTGTDLPAQPYKPYTPVINAISISYTAVTNVGINTIDADFANRDIQFYHLSPFGEAEQAKTLNTDQSVYLLPQFSHAEDGSTSLVPDIAEFLIGLQNLTAQQSVNILFQVLEGTSDPVVSIFKNLITWNYLSDNRWKPFTDQQVVDNTNFLRQSDIISFQIPELATTANTIMPANYLWIKAAISTPTDPKAPSGSNKPGAVCKLLNVLAQAAQVTFADNGNDPAFLTNALPAKTISKMVVSQSAIKSITQPYPSFGGKPIEDNSHFYVRASERLRHKDRAITIWDYERLVLEAFPEIHRVKCLNHTKYENGKVYEDAPGYVTVITIPDLTNHNEINPLRPYTNADTIDQIQAYLQQRISCQVNLNVNNPIFEEVQMVFDLKLMAGRDYSYYSQLLQNSITQFLSPWAYGKADDVQFGGMIEKSVLINFIEAQPYVDYITDVQLFLLSNDPAAPPPVDQDEITATTSISILVSVPPDKHLITEIADTDPSATITVCIDPNYIKNF